MKKDKHITFIDIASALALLFVTLSAAGQSSNHTYIVEKVFTNAAGSASNVTISYYDGLGRLSETVNKNAWLTGSSVSGSIISTITYDACGRPSKTLLPTGKSGNTGDYVSHSSALTTAVSQYGDNNPYTEIQYDSNPLDKVRREWGAGAEWRQADKKTSHAYLTNKQATAARNLRTFTVEYADNDDVPEIIVRKGSNYTNGVLRIEQVTDEDGRRISIFTDALGRTILSRRIISNSSFLDTYYCYDSAGRLVAVLPPELSSRLISSSYSSFSTSSSSNLKRYGFFYRYDAKGQLIAKKLPGAEWIYYIYDKGGRLVYSQDGNQRTDGEWSFVLQDCQGRECIRGTVERNLSLFDDPLGNVHVFAQRNEPATDMTDYGYLSVNFDLHGADVLCVTWYEDYSFLGEMDGIPSAASSTSPTRYANPSASSGLGEKYSYSGVGQMTGKWEKVLGESSGNVYLWTVLYYDKRGRVAQESHSTHRGGWQRTNTGYNFRDLPLKACTVSHDPVVTGDMTELYTYTYDAWCRPRTVTHKINSLTAVTLHDYTYDGAGRLVSDARNGDTDLAEHYTYNPRSWMTGIKVGGNAQLGTLGETFTEALYYHTQRPSNPQATVQWSGNVSAMDWMAGSDGVTRRYDFTYDTVSRLTGAAYGDDDGGAGLYTRGYTYDKNGNVTAVTTPSETVQYSYVGNHLSSGSNYSYDANGNLKKDLGRDISSISYNSLNLPSSVSISGSSPFADGELYLYSAGGVKLQAKNLTPLVPAGQPDNRQRKDYVGNLVYDRTSLKKILLPGGYVDVTDTANLYRFFVADHLGNNRLVADASGSILQTNHYDPYGQSLPAGAAANSGNPYKFGGKEYDNKLLSYDFGARYYTASNPRWTTMDPLCEKYYNISPYAYCAGNPVNLVDPNGMKFTPQSWEYLNLYSKSLSDKYSKASHKLETIKRQLSDESLSERKKRRIEKKINEQQEVMQEMLTAGLELLCLIKSSQEYDISIDYSISQFSNDNTEIHGLTCFDMNSSTVCIKLNSISVETIAHELKHAYQFEMGKTGFSIINGQGVKLLHDYHDEEEAFTRGAFFGGIKNMPSSYDKLDKDHRQISRNTPQFLQSYANNHSVVFRFEGITYLGRP